MEGLLPFLYRAILHLASGGETPLFRNDESSPDASPRASYYVRLAAGAGDVPAFLSAAARGYYDRG